MPVEIIDNLDDRRLEPYRNLKATNRTRWSNQFIAEGSLVVDRLLDSDFPVVSLLARRRMAEHIVPRVPHDLPVFLLEDALAAQLIGYPFHTGVLACGKRKAGLTIDALVTGGGRSFVLAVCPNVNDPENIGAIIRLSAGLGVAGVVLGRGCADPFSRRVLRVSTGTAFRVPLIESDDLRADLLRLRDEFGVELNATVLSPEAEPLEYARRSERMAILFGNEKHGLDPQWIELCDRRLTIPMTPGADSLNVAVAAGICFYHVMRLAAQRATE